MKAIERLSKAISAAEEELDEIDRVIDPLTDEKQAALSRITADLLSGVIDDAEAAKLREQAELELDRLVRQRRATCGRPCLSYEPALSQSRRPSAWRRWRGCGARRGTRSRTGSGLCVACATGLSLPPPWMRSRRCLPTTTSSALDLDETAWADGSDELARPRGRRRRRRG